jgi:hypothetical protein
MAFIPGKMKRHRIENIRVGFQFTNIVEYQSFNFYRSMWSIPPVFAIIHQFFWNFIQKKLVFKSAPDRILKIFS